MDCDRILVSLLVHSEAGRLLVHSEGSETLVQSFVCIASVEMSAQYEKKVQFWDGFEKLRGEARKRVGGRASLLTNPFDNMHKNTALLFCKQINHCLAHLHLRCY